MYVVVGLGNPGAEYKFTRHNIGFLVVDALSEFLKAPFQNEKFNAQIAKFSLALDPPSNPSINGLLVKPQTFMNLSGEAVQAILAFYKVPKENLLVIHDDVDLPFGEIRYHKNRGHGGQNGVRNIHEKIGSDYSRIKVGIGRPSSPQMSVADYVLQNFSNEQTEKLSEVIGAASDEVIHFLEKGDPSGT